MKKINRTIHWLLCRFGHHHWVLEMNWVEMTGWDFCLYCDQRRVHPGMTRWDGKEA